MSELKVRKGFNPSENNLVFMDIGFHYTNVKTDKIEYDFNKYQQNFTSIKNCLTIDNLVDAEQSYEEGKISWSKFMELVKIIKYNHKKESIREVLYTYPESIKLNNGAIKKIQRTSNGIYGKLTGEQLICVINKNTKVNYAQYNRDWSLYNKAKTRKESVIAKKRLIYSSLSILSLTTDKGTAETHIQSVSDCIIFDIDVKPTENVKFYKSKELKIKLSKRLKNLGLLTVHTESRNGIAVCFPVKGFGELRLSDFKKSIEITREIEKIIIEKIELGDIEFDRCIDKLRQIRKFSPQVDENGKPEDVKYNYDCLSFEISKEYLKKSKEENQNYIYSKEKSILKRNKTNITTITRVTTLNEKDYKLTQLFNKQEDHQIILEKGNYSYCSKNNDFEVWIREGGSSPALKFHIDSNVFYNFSTSDGFFNCKEKKLEKFQLYSNIEFCGDEKAAFNHLMKNNYFEGHLENYNTYLTSEEKLKCILERADKCSSYDDFKIPNSTLINLKPNEFLTGVFNQFKNIIKLFI